MSLTPFDYTMFAIVLISVGISIWRGLVREVMSILSWIAAIWVGLHYTVPFADTILASAIANPSGRYATAFLVVFIGTVFVL